jgi:cystathionine beta-lyase
LSNTFTAEFDRIIDRSNTSSSKWVKYAGRDILPYWIADMEFPAPGFVLDAIRERIDDEIIGYTKIPGELNSAFQGWLQRTSNWTVPEEWLVWIPGVVPGFNLAARAVAEANAAVMIPTPVYYPFLQVPEHSGLELQKVDLKPDQSGRWNIDFDELQTKVTQNTRLLMFCNPQNPTGRVYSKAELTALADFCMQHKLILCSDEIHCSLVLDDNAQHHSIASLSPEIAERSISLFAASKTYNIPGLPCAVAVIPDADLRHAFKRAMMGLVPGVGPLAIAASIVAFADQSSYLPELRAYLRGNYQRLREAIGPRVSHLEGTYLAWIDMRDTPVGNAPGRFFEDHGLGLSDGAAFGGPGYVRFNFACPTSFLDQGLERFQQAMASLDIR